MADGLVNCLAAVTGERFAAYNGDCVPIMAQLPDNSIDFSVYSPPFGSLFVYSDSIADMGNSSSDGEFADHYAFAVREKFRITKPGRISAVHCSDLPLTKWKDGAVGIKDFSGEIIRIHQDAGWILHSRRTIWKCPVVEMTRTKHVGLLFKQLQKDSAKSRGGMPDYLLTFVKPGDNAEPISHTPDDFPLDQWQEWASPIWVSVDQSNVLNVKMAREAKDERHLCPLQLDVIERAIILWSNPGNIVFSPFTGIGSEGYMALKLGRKFIGTELKESYFRQAVANLQQVDAQSELFGASVA
ncbi:MAG: DNA-methyltransferase [Rhizomicrobium sp.]